MKLQREPYDCGVYAILNGARALGVRLTAPQIRKHTATDEQGTTEHGILNALEKLGFEHEEFRIDSVNSTSEELAFEALFCGFPVILSVEKDRHWVTVIGTLAMNASDARVLTFDSWPARWNAQENGVESHSKRQLMKWWKPGADGNRYAIVMRRRKK